MQFMGIILLNSIGVNEMGILTPRVSKFGNLTSKKEEPEKKSLGQFSMGKKPDILTPGSKILNIEDFVLNKMYRNSARQTSLKTDSVYMTFYKIKKNGRYQVVFNIGKDIIETFGLNEGEKPRFILCHHPEDKRNLILIKSDNGNVMQKQGSSVWVLTLSWDIQQGWIPAEEDLARKQELEFELFDNAIVMHA